MAHRRDRTVAQVRRLPRDQIEHRLRIAGEADISLQHVELVAA